jgi:hypothetical protein
MATATKAARKPAAKKAPAKEVKGKNSNGQAGANARVRRMEEMAKQLSTLGLYYSYGGGRVGGRIVQPDRNAPWTDCSGGATYLLDVGGVKLKNDAGSTWSLATEGEAGEGEMFTLFIKNDPGDEHVICRFRLRPKPWHRGEARHRWWEVGGSDNRSSRGGPSFFTPGAGMGLSIAERVAQFPITRHFPELEA